MIAAYDQHKSRAAARSRRQTREAQDIGSIPPVADVARRQSAERSFRRFCEAYFPETFCLQWSDDHLEVIADVERVVERGDTIAIAMPRGSGKTSLCVAAVEWAMLTGRHLFVVLIGPTAAHAKKLLTNVKAHLSANDRLLADFPEVCYPIRQLGGEARSAGGQRHYGERTLITWTENELVLPTIAGSQSSGVCLRVAGLEGSVRGMQHTLPDGRTVRPSLALVDDPQTKKSARSPAQTQSRIETIQGDVMGLAGPGERMSVLMPCTVIAEGDLADQMLDRDEFPEWQGRRTKLVYAWPPGSAEAHWDEYFRLRDESYRRGDRGEEATEYYRCNKAAMDAGSRVGWPARFDAEDGELSALQHAMNLRHKDPAAFAAEYQNEPVVAQVGGGAPAPDKKAIAAKAVATLPGVVPEDAERLTAFIDVQQSVLWWMVCSWASGLRGHVVAYGAWPDQGRAYYTKRDAKKTYARELPEAGFDAQLYHALDTLTDHLIAAEWRGEAGAEFRIERCLIDNGWGSGEDLVSRFCRESKHAPLIMASKGVGLRARDTPFAERAKKDGIAAGHHWQLRKPQRRGKRHVVIDTNRWKSLVHDRLRSPLGSPGAITLHADPAGRHKMLVDHLTAERPTQTAANGRSLQIWEAISNRDNDWLDCLVGCAVAASTLGVGAGLSQDAPPAPAARRRRRAQAKF
ncbi:MAG: terminase gpA endonuclease subunit [Planctomycetota bacterium]